MTAVRAFVVPTLSQIARKDGASSLFLEIGMG